ncbi:DUF6172 family protein [Xylophilus sp. GOD-11R]|uniref:DUF6172 family protein n=1 Tax=Xylophilus sp. GOD-11R TaxID=3089814 RepID=UPI00298C41B3|nr:DUF6172 family protein [Xylophilus sp. GOD-11R]WPB58576.1 DUF6172 family protein [Xylophilus sp. GOD-11R]
MKKTYSLAVEGKNRDRLLDAVKHDIRRYLKRERRRDLPAGVDFWDFDCRFGATEQSAERVHLGSLIESVDAAAASGADSFYVEVLTTHGVRNKARPGGTASDAEGAAAAFGDHD